MQCAAVTTLVAATRVPPQNWLPEASVICMTNGYAVVVVVVPPTMGCGAALAVGEAMAAVAAAAAQATSVAAVRLARVRPNMWLLRGVAPVGDRTGVGGVHGGGGPLVERSRELGEGPTPVCPGERHAPYARTRNPRLPMREPPRGGG